MQHELDLFSQPPTGEDLKQAGIEAAVQHANNKSEEWSQRAYEYFVKYLSMLEKGTNFMAEQARVFAEKRGLALPPSKRAWGGVVQKLRNEGAIRKVGHQTVENVKGHKGFAALWEKL